jgi:crotonobetaine/carnitine-CoA ligase
VHAILYTSGTTGPAKGVMLSHRAYLNSARAFVRQFVPAGADDIFYTCLPLFHINAQAHTVLPALDLNAGMAIGERFSASGFWNEINAHRATIFNLLGAMVSILCKQPPAPGDRSHGARVAACAATPSALWIVFEARFGVRVIEGYGLTETAGFCVSDRLETPKIGSVGTPMDFVEARVADPLGQAVAPGERGEILLRAREPHAFMEGYFAMPEQTADAMRDGWFHSGDLGYADSDGSLYFVDRIKQCIRRRGENISSSDIEAIVSAHPCVLEAAAIGVPSELGEEDVKVCVVPHPGMTVEPVEIVQWCEDQMAYFMVPRYVEIRASLPKTATERVEKYRLKEDGVGASWDRQAAGYKLKRA